MPEVPRSDRFSAEKSRTTRPAGVWSVVAIFLIAALTMSFVFRSADQRSEQTLLPRYCDRPQEHLELVRRILTQPEPAGGEARRPYIVAAKILFIEPRRSDETVEAYMRRLGRRLAEVCR